MEEQTSAQSAQATLESLFDSGRTLDFKKGDMVLNPEDAKHSIVYLKSGLVKTFCIGKNGEEHIHAIFTTGDVFPLAVVFGDIPHNVYFEAVSDVHVSVLSKTVFMEVVRTNPKLCFEAFQILAKMFATYILRVDNLEFKFARERLAYRLLTLAAKLGVPKGYGIELPHINQYDIGAMINLSRESVSRELSRFERLGYIGHTGSCIIIKDIGALHREIGILEVDLEGSLQDSYHRTSTDLDF
jgi:CRP-like cAMP-binding protein